MMRLPLITLGFLCSIMSLVLGKSTVGQSVVAGSQKPQSFVRNEVDTKNKPNKETDKNNDTLGIKDVPLPGVRIVDRGYFIIVYKDALSGKFVSRVCDEVISLANKYFEVAKVPPAKIIIELIPLSEVKFKTPYKIIIDKVGAVTVSIPWSKETKFGDLCQAIVRGFMMMWTHDNFGLKRAESIPPWIDLALSVKLETFIQLGNQELFKYEARDIPKLSIEEIVSGNSVKKYKLDSLTLHSFWLFEFLRKSSPNRAEFGRFLAKVLAGEDCMGLVEKYYLKDLKYNKEEKFLWWAVGMQSMIGSDSAWLYTMEESRILLHQFGSITVQMYDSDSTLNLSQIWNQRKDPTVVAALRWSLRDMKLELYSINPVYYNSMHSLGQVYEAFLGDDLKLCNQMIANFSKDYYDAIALDKEISKSLQ
jgi:hypothetical protein